MWLAVLLAVGQVKGYNAGGGGSDTSLWGWGVLEKVGGTIRFLFLVVAETVVEAEEVLIKKELLIQRAEIKPPTKRAKKRKIATFLVDDATAVSRLVITGTLLFNCLLL